MLVQVVLRRVLFQAPTVVPHFVGAHTARNHIVNPLREPILLEDAPMFFHQGQVIYHQDDLSPRKTMILDESVLRHTGVPILPAVPFYLKKVLKHPEVHCL